jgi:Tetracyclin repressor-like, C-terminal domain
MTATKVRVLDAAIDLVGTEGLRALTHLFEFTTGVNRTLTTARLVLFMEASHNAALRDDLTRGRAAMEATALPALAQLGARDPLAAGAAIAACFEGLILHRIARHDDADPRPIFDLVVRAALA